VPSAAPGLTMGQRAGDRKVTYYDHLARKEGNCGHLAAVPARQARSAGHQAPGNGRQCLRKSQVFIVAGTNRIHAWWSAGSMGSSEPRYLREKPVRTAWGTSSSGTNA
jgi:hypothetical protein